jgi:hypothetical protein
MKTALALALALALAMPLLAVDARADENFRCGKWIASKDMSVSELLAKCGEPSKREKRTEDVYSRSVNSGGTYKSGETVIETWTYERGSVASALVVTIVDGRIESIERKR